MIAELPLVDRLAHSPEEFVIRQGRQSIRLPEGRSGHRRVGRLERVPQVGSDVGAANLLDARSLLHVLGQEIKVLLEKEIEQFLGGDRVKLLGCAYGGKVQVVQTGKPVRFQLVDLGVILRHQAGDSRPLLFRNPEQVVECLDIFG